MSESWKKILEKVKDTEKGPVASDWEAMNALIEKHPELSTPHGKSRPFVLWGLGVVLLVVVGIGFLIYPQAQHGEALPAATEGTPYNSEIAAFEQADENLTEDLNALPAEKQQLRTSDEGQTIQKPMEQVENTDERDLSRNSISDHSKNNGAGMPGFQQSSKDETPLGVVGAYKVNKQMEEPSLLLEGPIRPNPEAWSDDVSLEKQRATVSLQSLRQKSVYPCRCGLIWDMQHATDEGGKKLPSSVDLLRHQPVLKNGFKVNDLSIGAVGFTDFQGRLSGVGAAFEVGLKRGETQLQTGLWYYQLHYASPVENKIFSWKVDTTTTLYINERELITVDSAWVITGPMQGGYAYDTLRTIEVDTSTEVRIDSAQTITTALTTKRLKLSYVELPLLLGYRFHFGRMAFDASGGIALNQLIQSFGEEVSTETTYGVDILVRPGVRYFLNDEWSGFVKVGLRYGVVGAVYRRDKLYGDFQFGLSWHLR